MLRKTVRSTSQFATTVQNVIHGRIHKVSKENLERIRAVLYETGYLEKRAHVPVKKEQAGIIGVVIYANRRYEETAASDPFYGQIIGFLEDEIRKAGYYMMLCIEADVESVFQMAESWHISGLVAVSFTEKSLEKLRALMEDCPVVGIDVSHRSGPIEGHVGLDDENGGYEMTRYLLEQGYETILFVREPDRQAENMRLQGYRRALREYGIPIRERYLLILERVDGSNNEKCLSYIRSFAGTNTVIFCTSDLLALKVMRYLLKNGIQIPEEIGVAGFDDNVYARMVWPTLTTMRQNVRAKAEAAVKLLLKAKEGGREAPREKGGEEPREILLQAEVVNRFSTKKKPEGTT